MDVLVDFAENASWSLYEWVDMIEKLNAIFGRVVHVVSNRGFRNPFRGDGILKIRHVIDAA